MILLDTSGFLAAQAPDQRHHLACADVLRDAPGPFILSPFVVAELDYLVGKILGVEAELRLLEEIVRKAYLHAPFQAGDLEQARQIVDQHRELGVGLADASLVVLSRRYSTLDILSLDERHFRVLTGAGDQPFRLLPADL